MKTMAFLKRLTFCVLTPRLFLYKRVSNGLAQEYSDSVKLHGSNTFVVINGIETRENVFSLYLQGSLYFENNITEIIFKWYLV